MSCLQPKIPLTILIIFTHLWYVGHTYTARLYPQNPLTILTIFTHVIYVCHRYTACLQPQIPLTNLTNFTHLIYVGHRHTTCLHPQLLPSILTILSTLYTLLTDTQSSPATWNSSYKSYNFYDHVFSAQTHIHTHTHTQTHTPQPHHLNFLLQFLQFYWRYIRDL